MAFRKPATKKVGLKFLSYGLTGTSKTTFALSFPQIAALDGENGMSLYEGRPLGKNLTLIDNTQSYDDLQDSLEDIMDTHKELGIESFVIDSETKFYENIKESIMTVEEKRAKNKGRDVLDTNLSIRSWGKIGQIADKLQNIKIDLTSQGIHLVSIAQASEIKEKQGESFVVKGYKPDMRKQAEFDYDVVLYHYTEEDVDGNVKYFAKVEKDRSEVFTRGDKIENPSFELWAERLSDMNGKETLNTRMVENVETSIKSYEEELNEEEKTIVERFGDLMKKATASDKEKIGSALKKAKITSFVGLTAKQQEQLEKIYKEFKQ